MILVVILAILFTIGSAQVDFCWNRQDGSYCYGNYIYYCQFSRTTNIFQCTSCFQSTFSSASCTSYQVPPGYCSGKISGYYCYNPIGSNIYTSVRCDLNSLVSQQVCQGTCSFTSGLCGSSTTTSATCSPSCTYGCDFWGNCKKPPYCSQTILVTPTAAPYCSTLIGARNVDYLTSIGASDTDAKTLVDILTGLGTANYTAACQSTIKQFACEDKFLNCNERGTGYRTCKSLCQSTLSCVASAFTNSPIDCRAECNSGNIIGFSVVLLLIVLFVSII